MLTTAGIALRTALLNDVTAAGAASSRCGSRTVTTSPCGAPASRSGRRVETTNSTARHTVAVWQNVSQSLRMDQEIVGLIPDDFLRKGRTGSVGKLFECVILPHWARVPAPAASGRKMGRRI